MIKAKKITASTPQKTSHYTGYPAGGISPFSSRRQLPLYMESSIGQLPFLYINGGKRGLLVKLKTVDLIRLLHPELVEVSRPAAMEINFILSFPDPG